MQLASDTLPAYKNTQMCLDFSAFSNNKHTESAHTWDLFFFSSSEKLNSLNKKNKKNIFCLSFFYFKQSTQKHLKGRTFINLQILGNFIFLFFFSHYLSDVSFDRRNIYQTIVSLTWHTPVSIRLEILQPAPMPTAVRLQHGYTKDTHCAGSTS